MKINVRGAREHNLQSENVEISGNLTVVTGVSGSGKTSLVFDTIYHEAKRRFLDVYSLGSVTSRLAPADVEEISGLGPAVAVGQNLLNRNPGSILATASGLHPFFRLLYARFGKRICPLCYKDYSSTSEDDLIQEIFSLSRNHLVPLFLVLFRGIPGCHKTLLAGLSTEFDLEAIFIDGEIWGGRDLDGSQPHELKIKINEFHSSSSVAEIRKAILKTKDIGAHIVNIKCLEVEEEYVLTPECPSCGYWFMPLEPVHFHTQCPHCEGKGCRQCEETGLTPQAAVVTWQGYRFPNLLTLTVDTALELFKSILPTQSQTRLFLEITRRLAALQRVGLGYICLNRSSPTLSRGESQRVRLASSLICRLEDMLHVLDEPTIGQHPVDVQNLISAFRDLPGPVIFVEHDRQAAAKADQALDLGPGAGSDGGKIVYNGPPSNLWTSDTLTGRFFSLRAKVGQVEKRTPADKFFSLKEITFRNLKGIDIDIPVSRLTVITGVSGSGKSTLVEDVLYPILECSKPIGCKRFVGEKLKPVLVDQSPIGKNPRSNPATYTKLSDIIRNLYSNTTGLSASHFSFNRQEGACPTCHGLGAVEMTMRYLPSTWITCSDCGGERFTDEVLGARVTFNGKELSIADFYRLSIGEAMKLLIRETRLAESDRESAIRILSSLDEVGLGYLSLGQPSPTLSGGEAQRVKLARYLGTKSLSKQLLILDEPSTGLHPYDLTGLLIVLDRLVRSGATVVVVEHNIDIIKTADWVIDLGPGAGEFGGEVIFAGTLDGLLKNNRSSTAKAIREDKILQPLVSLQDSKQAKQESAITITNARANNLKIRNVSIPKGKITVVTGVSGSGKSSLVRDVLEAEARRRYLETLSMYERQGVSEGPEAQVDDISGLGVVLTVGSEKLVYSRRATVGTATEISHHISVLFANISERKCEKCHDNMVRSSNHISCPECGQTIPVPKNRHFFSSTYSAACQKCNGIGSMQAPQPKKLIIHPEQPLIAGAMYSPGFFPKGYLGKPYNHGYYMVLALGERYNFDPATTPWNEISLEAQNAFLYGSDEALEITVHSRTGRTYTHKQRFPGFYGFIRDWDVGGTYTDNVLCPACHGTRFRNDYLLFTLAGMNIHQINQLPLLELQDIFKKLRLSTQESYVQSSLQTVQRRLNFLTKVGVGYLHLDRVAGTLSAGEAQRIRLANLLGSRLTALTLILDEPTRGLHPAEVDTLTSALEDLRDDGNTIITVEHDPTVIQKADHIIDFGPGAGRNGGEIVAQGSYQEFIKLNTVTARWVSGRCKPLISTSTKIPERWLILKGARENNLRIDELRIPLNMLVGVCGVSGSGKSTLLIDTLGRVLAPKKQTTSVAYEPVDPGEYKSIKGAPKRTIIVDQSRGGMYYPAAYLGLLPLLKKIYVETPDAIAAGLNEQSLSARCSACGGSGTISVDMQFLPDVHVPCETCHGTGYKIEAWQVRIGGYSLPELMDITINEVYTLFENEPRIAKPLNTACEVGLGYLVMHQPGHTLSGGEIQRLKIAHELMRGEARSTLYILDEPTVGQHLEDVQRLVKVLYRLLNEGGSIVVVEHHPHLLMACDWLIEMGPGGGPQGGRIIAVGTPQEIARGNTPIAPFLAEVMR